MKRFNIQPLVLPCSLAPQLAKLTVLPAENMDNFLSNFPTVTSPFPSLVTILALWPIAALRLVLGPASWIICLAPFACCCTNFLRLSNEGVTHLTKVSTSRGVRQSLAEPSSLNTLGTREADV